MPQSLILLKTLPEPDYLHDLQERGVYRASMNFLPGGCYAGAALYDASASYKPLSADTSTSSSSSADSTCPDPGDTTGCLMWEIFDQLHKLSWAEPLEFNAFVFLEIEAGRGAEHLDLVQRVAGPESKASGYTETELGLEYLAYGRLLGCGSYNAVAEVLADDHERMQTIVDAITDSSAVRRYSLGRLAARDTRGFGEREAVEIPS